MQRFDDSDQFRRKIALLRILCSLERSFQTHFRVPEIDTCDQYALSVRSQFATPISARLYKGYIRVRLGFN
jgi:hypothetical protein